MLMWQKQPDFKETCWKPMTLLWASNLPYAPQLCNASLHIHLQDTWTETVLENNFTCNQYLPSTKVTGICSAYLSQ